MSPVDIGVYGEELYEQVLPLHGPDPDGLARDYIGAITSQAIEIDDLARDDARGRPGWGVILDVSECPVKGLPWLAQVAGVSLRDRKLIPLPTILNGNGELGDATGWRSEFTGGGTTTLVTTSGHLASPGGFHSTLTSGGVASGEWDVIEPNGYGSLLPVTAGGLCGVAASLYVTHSLAADAPGQNFALDALFYDADLVVMGSTGVDSSALPLGALVIGDSMRLSGVTQVPDGAVYAGAAVRVPFFTSPGAMNSQVDVGEIVTTLVDAIDSPVSAWPYVPPLRLETDAEWAVYARDAIRRQSGRNRGTPDGIISAAEDTLTGTRRARLLDRLGGNAYALELITRPSETPDPDATLAAALTQKPAGMSLILTMTEDLLIDEEVGTIDTASGTIDVPT